MRTMSATPEQLFETVIAPAMPHPGAERVSERGERTTLRATQERVAAHYEAMARQREEREAVEAHKRKRNAGRPAS